jgi:hypothetical protein
MLGKFSLVTSYITSYNRTMGFPTRVQLIQRKDSEQWYINFPSALAQAMEFEKGEEVQWLVSDKAHLILSRQNVPPDPVSVKKTTRS